MKSHLLVIFMIICLGQSAEGQNFAEMSDTYGISGGYGLPGMNASGGISVQDINGDGLDDLTFATRIGEYIQMYLNDGNGTMTLIDPPIITNTQELKTVLWVDYDNDNDLDLFTAAYGSPNRLYQNDGNLNMTDVTAAAMLPLTNESTTCAAFTDYDRDGDLDLYVGNYGFITGFPPPPPDTNSMFRNNGDGTFTNVTTLTGTNNGQRQTWCATFFDYNQDGWEDLYVANDRVNFPNTLYHNNGDGTFSDVSGTSGTALTIDAMNVGVGDADNDGDLDIYVTNTFPSAYLRNNGDSTFTDVANANGTIFNRIGWGGNFFDYDNDLDLDLYVCTSLDLANTPNALYVNDGTGNFTEPLFNSGGLGGTDTDASHCNAIGDINDDGKYDIIVNQFNGDENLIWENQTANSNHWFKLRLLGVQSNRFAIGAEIIVWIGGQSYLRTTHSHQAFWAQNSQTHIIGTGTHSSIDSLVILWPFPSGSSPFTKEVIDGSCINMEDVNILTEGQGCGCVNPTTYLVTTTANEGAGSLRNVIASAASCDTVKFDPLLQNDTITLIGVPLILNKSVVIQGFDQASLVVMMADSSASWSVSTGVVVLISDLEILDASDDIPNSMINNMGMLTLENVQLTSQNVPGNNQSLITSSGMLTQRGVVIVRLD